MHRATAASFKMRESFREIRIEKQKEKKQRKLEGKKACKQAQRRGGMSTSHKGNILAVKVYNTSELCSARQYGNSDGFERAPQSS